MIRLAEPRPRLPGRPHHAPTCSGGSTSTIREGEFVTIMGPSGAGKSTLLGILGMLDHAWTGEFGFLGEPVHALPPKKRVELNKRYIGFVFQKYHLLDDLTVYENLEIPLSYRDVKPKERAAIVAETLDRFQMVGKKDLYPSQLSGGQQQLVGRGAGGDRPARSCSWPTSRPATCTARRARRSWSSSPGSTGRAPRSCR